MANLLELLSPRAFLRFSSSDCYCSKRVLIYYIFCIVCRYTTVHRKGHFLDFRALTIADLLLDYQLFGGLRCRYFGLLNLLLLKTGLLLSLILLLTLLPFAWFVTELVTARMLTFVPTSAARTRSIHHSDYVDIVWCNFMRRCTY